jgi:two-component system, cell cycle sensor histidine kinase and response regulator CckA
MSGTPAPSRSHADPPAPRPGLSLGVKLPLFLAALMAVMIAAQTWTDYRHELSTARRQATIRLNQVADQMVQSLTQVRDELHDQMQRVAGDPAVVAFLAAPEARRGQLGEPALAELRTIGTPSQSIALELLDATGRVVLHTGEPGSLRDSAADRDLRREARDSADAVFGPLREAGDSSAFPVVIRVTEAGRLLGYVANWRRIGSSPATQRQLGSLIGTGGRVFVGNVHDSVWTNLYTRANPPPINVDTTHGVVEYRRRAGEMLAVARVLPSLPWAVVVEFPADSVATPARAGLRELLLMDGLVLLLGIGGAGWLSRRPARRLRRLTTSAETMAGGTPADAAGARGDEITRLSESFDAMAERVRAAIADAENSEAQYRNLFDSIPLPTYLLDIETLRFLAVNEAAIAHYGYSRREFLAMTAHDIRPPEDVPRIETEVRDLGPVPQPRGTWRHIKKDGTRIEVEVMGHEIRFQGGRAALAVVMDVTERNHQQEAVRQSEERYRALIREAPYGIALSSIEGVFTEANPALVRMLGYDSAAELIGTRVHDVYADPGERRAIAHELFQTGQSTRDALQWKRRDGRLVTARLAARLVPGQQGSEPYVEAIMEDVTDRLRLEEQFHQAQKMEAIGRLAGGIAHDFNNLLTVIMTTTELLMEQEPVGAAPGPAAELAEVYRSAQRGAELTRQLLAFSRRQVLAMHPLSVSHLVGDMEDLLRRLLGEDVQLKVVVHPDTDVIRADASQLEQVLMNLAVNARDAMPDGGMLLIETGPVDVAPGETAGPVAIAPGAYVRIIVTDTGSGMSPEVLEHLFEPFFTTKPKDKGTGLGLATVYGIVKQLGGYVWVYSEPGRGSTFKIYLPRVRDHERPARAGPAHPADERGNQTILIAEDEPAIRALLTRVLKGRGYRVLAAASGEEALHAVAGNPGPIHLLVSDVVMAGMSGPQLAARLAESHPETVPLFLSGYTDEAVLRLGVATGRVAFLQKPFTHTTFLDKVREVLEAAESADR